MRLRDLALKLENQTGTTLTERIARALEGAIRDGRLKPGVAIPGSRALAEDLGVTRNTVIAALAMLEDEGWLVTERSRGTFVADPLPLEALPTSTAHPPSKEGDPLGFDLPSRLSPLSATTPQSLTLSDGIPDSRLAPTDAMAKAYQRALRRHGEELLQYGEPSGNQLLRESVAAWATERYGVSISAKQVLITRGSRVALTLMSLALLREGDRVGVESPGNRAAWDTMRQCAEIHLHGIPVDEEGIRLDALSTALESTRLRALYLTPRRQFPTARTMGVGRGKALLKLAAEHRIAVLEDDYDGEYHYGEQRPLPLLALDQTGQVIHLGSLSRLLAPGLRLGFLIAQEGLIERLSRVRRSVEWQGDRVLEWAVADLIRDGELARHLRRVKKIYEVRRDFMCGLLNQELGEYLSFEVPTGGLGLWARVAKIADAEKWIASAKECGLVLNPPQHFFLGEAEPFVRVGFSQVDEAQITEAVRRLKQALVQSKP
jgi:GntR family transcriptional regulator/MocR family aminotransferase